jgi:hypothetical protein
LRRPDGKFHQAIDRRATGRRVVSQQLTILARAGVSEEMSMMRRILLTARKPEQPHIS